MNMQRLTRMAGNVSVVLFGLLIVASCTATVLSRVNVSQVEDIPDLEVTLAQIDGRADTRPYVQVLNYLSARCTEENRTAIAGMARSTAKLHLFEGEKVDNLDALRMFYEDADRYAHEHQSERVSCLNVLSKARRDFQ